MRAQQETATKAQDRGRTDARSKYPTSTKGKQPCLCEHPVQRVVHGSFGISSTHVSWEGTGSTERGCPPVLPFFQRRHKCVAMPPMSHDSPEHAAATGPSQLPHNQAGMGGTKLCSSQSQPCHCGHGLCREPAVAEATHQLNGLLLVMLIKFCILLMITES